jgi:hypothetical protein
LLPISAGNIYDPKLHGLDWEAKVADAKARIARASSWWAAMLEIAVLTDDLNDSHTIFVPALPPSRTDYGWKFQIVGGRCYVTHVRPKSDAEAKGLNQVLTLDEVKASRANLPKINYSIEGVIATGKFACGSERALWQHPGFEANTSRADRHQTVEQGTRVCVPERLCAAIRERISNTCTFERRGYLILCPSEAVFRTTKTRS